MEPNPIPPCASGMTRPKSPNWRNSSRNAPGISAFASQSRNSFSRPLSSCRTEASTWPSVSFSPSAISGKGMMISSSISPIQSDWT